MVRYTGVNHLAMVTGDMDATVRFWRDLLGLRLVVGLGHPGYRHYFFELTENDMIAFFEWDGVEPLPERDHGFPVRGPVAFDHLSMGVDSDDDLWELKDRLEAADMWVSEVVDHGFIRSIYAFDPNGIPIEFSVAEPGVDVRRYPAMTDSRPTKTAQQGAEPVPGVWPEVRTPTPKRDRAVYEGEGAAIVDEVRRRMGRG
ncbi:VOC family protein [Pseudodesulfovibrio senegalensis]|uniref:VOC family protein n=1 Tax=Pseudodesulfovibrio senegalensis TaxID=1721087 RepID=A0A6N6N1F4_9BACT|nr:VOC family protein [Pseudodesulfovibrio senegalensis]KAB1441724.1 VOC family protein [Pseudodesulfovibrio senegalensis]